MTHLAPTETPAGQDLDTRKAVSDKVCAILAGELGLALGDIRLDSYITDDLGADSLDCVEIAVILEAEFGIKVLDEDLMDLETVDDLVEFVCGETEAAPA